MKISVHITFTLIYIGINVSAQVIPYAPEIFPDKISGAVCGFGKDGKAIYFVREDTIKKSYSSMKRIGMEQAG